MVMIGIIKLNKIPIYGVDPDPTALSIDWINLIMINVMINTIFISIPLNIFLTIILLLKKVKFVKADKIALSIPLVSILLFCVFRFLLPNLFDWVTD